MKNKSAISNKRLILICGIIALFALFILASYTSFNQTDDGFLLDGFLQFIKGLFDFWQNHPGFRVLIYCGVVALAFFLGGPKLGLLTFSAFLDPILGAFTKSKLGQKLRNKNPRLYDIAMQGISLLFDIFFIWKLGPVLSLPEKKTLFDMLKFGAVLPFEVASIIEVFQKAYNILNPEAASKYVDGLMEYENSAPSLISLLLTLVLLSSVGTIKANNAKYERNRDFYKHLFNITKQNVDTYNFDDFYRSYRLLNKQNEYASKIVDVEKFFERNLDLIEQLGYISDAEETVEFLMDNFINAKNWFEDLSFYEKANYRLNNEDNEEYKRYIDTMVEMAETATDKNSDYLEVKNDMEYSWDNVKDMDPELYRYFAAIKRNLDSTNQLSDSNIFSGKNDFAYLSDDKEMLAILEDLMPGIKESFDYKGFEISYNFGTENALVKDDGAIVDLQSVPYEFIIYLKDKSNNLSKDEKSQIVSDFIEAIENKEELNVRDLFDIIFLDMESFDKDITERIEAIFNRVFEDQENLIEQAIADMTFDLWELLISFNIDDTLVDETYDEYKAYEYSHMIDLLKSRNNILSRELLQFYLNIYDSMKARFKPYFEQSKADFGSLIDDLETYRECYEEYMGSFKYLTDFVMPYNIY